MLCSDSYNSLIIALHLLLASHVWNEFVFWLASKTFYIAQTKHFLPGVCDGTKPNILEIHQIQLRKHTLWKCFINLVLRKSCGDFYKIILHFSIRPPGQNWGPRTEVDVNIRPSQSRNTSLICMIWINQTGSNIQRTISIYKGLLLVFELKFCC